MLLSAIFYKNFARFLQKIRQIVPRNGVEHEIPDQVRKETKRSLPLRSFIICIWVKPEAEKIPAV